MDNPHINAQQPSNAAIEQAAFWHATLNDEDVSPEDIVAFERWQQADEQHSLAYEKMKRVWHQFDTLSGDESKASRAALHDVLSHPLNVNSVKKSAVTLLSVVLCSLLAWPFFHSADSLDHSAAIGSRSAFSLQDGNHLLLNSGASVHVEYSDAQRRVVLEEGEVLANVVTAPSRPFVVATTEGTAMALGTEYAVSLRDDMMRVDVVESTVRLCLPGAGAIDSTPAFYQQTNACVVIPAGYAASIQHGELTQPYPSHFGALAWTQGKLVVEDQTLAAVLTELSRYHDGVLLFDKDAMASDKVSGVFSIDDIAQTLHLLANDYHLQIDDYWGDVVTIRKTQP